MCYASPGPRCSGHTREALDKALASGDKVAIATAQQEWERTPDGIKHLEDEGKGLQAEVNSSIRTQQIKAYKADEAGRKLLSIYSDSLTPEEKEEVSAEVGKLLRSPETDAATIVALAKATEQIARKQEKIDANTPWSANANEHMKEQLVVRRWSIAQDIAAHPSAPAGLLHRLAGNPSHLVRREVAAANSARPDTLALLANDPDGDVRLQVADNLAAPDEALSVLATDHIQKVRRAVAQHPNSSIATARATKESESLTYRILNASDDSSERLDLAASLGHETYLNDPSVRDDAEKWLVSKGALREEAPHPVSVSAPSYVAAWKLGFTPFLLDGQSD